MEMPMYRSKFGDACVHRCPCPVFEGPAKRNDPFPPAVCSPALRLRAILSLGLARGLSSLPFPVSSLSNYLKLKITSLPEYSRVLSRVATIAVAVVVTALLQTDLNSQIPLLAQDIEGLSITCLKCSELNDQLYLRSTISANYQSTQAFERMVQVKNLHGEIAFAPKQKQASAGREGHEGSPLLEERRSW